jgi:predicted negative regulator of RcsB-dependent stress response
MRLPRGASAISLQKGSSGNPVDTQTRHALKQDRFITATTSGLDWVGQNRASVIRWSVSVVILIALIVTSIVIFEQRSSAADTLLGQGLTIYETPIASPDQPTAPGDTTYATARDRAKAAYPLFSQAASQYGWLHAGRMARYFAGITAQDLGNTSEAEADLNDVVRSGGNNLSATAKVALANLYAQTGRTSQAVEEFRDLIAHPATTVPKASAQLMLAQIYEATQPEEARRLYAQIKDQDKDSEAAQIATQKLSGK